MTRLIKEHWPLGVIVGFFVGLLAIAIIGFSACDTDKDKLIVECVSSGKANFECVAMFQNYCKSNTASVVPMYVPIR